MLAVLAYGTYAVLAYGRRELLVYSDCETLVYGGGNFGAISSTQFILLYQQQIALYTGHCVLEALVGFQRIWDRL